MAAAGCALALAGAAPAGDRPAPALPSAVTLSAPSASLALPVGSRWRDERVLSAPALELSVDLGAGRDLSGTMSRHSREVIDVQVIAPAELALEFVQSQTTSELDLGSEHDRHAVNEPLDGEHVRAVLGSSGRWVARLAGGRRATRAQAVALRSLGQLWRDPIYPDGEVEIGASWTVDASKLKGMFGSEFARPHGEFEFTLARLVDHQGYSCAKITGSGRLLSKTRGLDASDPDSPAVALDAELDISLEILRALDLGVDLSVTGTGTMTIGNPHEGGALHYRATSPVEFSRTLRRRPAP